MPWIREWFHDVFYSVLYAKSLKILKESFACKTLSKAYPWLFLKAFCKLFTYKPFCIKKFTVKTLLFNLSLYLLHQVC